METASGPVQLLLATTNKGKIEELRAAFSALPIEIKTLKDYCDIKDVPETGKTFHDNAELKAIGYARQTGIMSLADDSGLEIFALGNAPGVHSARFGGTANDYNSKMRKILAMLDAVSDEGRSARFACSMALADATGRILTSVEGECLGTIANRPLGDSGFGYDPIFVPEGFDRTFGELDADVKRSISHRARASRLIIRYLLDFIAALT